MATHDSILRPPSTQQGKERMHQLLQKGYYPIEVLPAGVLPYVPMEKGPSLAMGLPKIPSGTVDSSTTHVPTIETRKECRWGPVVYVVLWKTLVRKSFSGNKNTQLMTREYIERVHGDTKMQMAILASYLVLGIQGDPSKETLRIAIDAALHKLRVAQGGHHEE